MARPSDRRTLVGARAAAPFDILRAGHAELRVTDLERSREFYVNQLGLVVTDEDKRTLHLRGFEERHHHSLVLRLAPVAAVGHLGFLVASDDDLEKAARWYRERQCEVRWIETGVESGIGRAVRVLDRLGFPLEFYHRMDKVESLLQRYELYRGARIQRIDHFNLHCPDVQSAFDLWFEGLGFRCSEYIEGDGEDRRLYAAWLYRKPNVHDVALTAGAGPRLHHIAFWTADTNSMVNLCDALGDSGWYPAIERGPGRHGVSNAFYLYLRDPDGHRVELYTSDYWTGDPDHEPKRWSATDARRRSYWGHPVPERWYLESSRVADLDGRLVEVKEPEVSELTPVLPS
jgi:3,4-dihydroxyphenylacetate 2,3-dioxygenase